MSTIFKSSILDHQLEQVTDMALEQLQKAGLSRMEGSTLSKDERTNCNQGKFHGLCTVLAS